MTSPLRVVGLCVSAGNSFLFQAAYLRNTDVIRQPKAAGISSGHAVRHYHPDSSIPPLVRRRYVAFSWAWLFLSIAPLAQRSDTMPVFNHATDDNDCPKPLFTCNKPSR